MPDRILDTHVHLWDLRGTPRQAFDLRALVGLEPHDDDPVGPAPLNPVNPSARRTRCYNEDRRYANLLH